MNLPVTTPTNILDAARLVAHVEKRVAGHGAGVQVNTRALRGGLVSPSVLHVSARYADAAGRRQRTSFVVKSLDGTSLREASIYEGLLARNGGLAPALLGVERSADTALLYLEPVVGRRRWPWRDLSLSARVLQKLAKLHEMTPAPDSIPDWDYDAELETAALQTLEDAENFARSSADATTRLGLPALRRLVRDLRPLRRQLLDCDVMPRTILHGDLHPGNVLVRQRGKKAEPLLLDWARARYGSPLEDVSAWLQWLGFWEPEVKRKHDSLLAVYLRARGVPTPPSRSLRNAYWISAALNCCAGALAYHLSVASSAPAGSVRRQTAVRAVHDCFRVIRRADAGRRHRAIRTPVGAAAAVAASPQA